MCDAMKNLKCALCELFSEVKEPKKLIFYLNSVCSRS